MVNAAAIPDLQKFGAKIFIRDGHIDVREGKPGHLNVLVEFRSIGEAYKTPEYQDMIRVRTPNNEACFGILEEGELLAHCSSEGNRSMNERSPQRIKWDHFTQLTDASDAA